VIRAVLSSRKALQTLTSISRSASPGPSPVFTPVHVSRALLLIGDEGPIGRIELSRRLGLGEGAVRTIIKHLGRNFVNAAKEGCVLTDRGAALYKSMRAKLSQVRLVNARELALDKASAAILVKGSGRRVRRGIEQRDASVRAGGTGACTLICRGGKLVMPMGDDEKWTLAPHDLLFENLRAQFSPTDDDVIVIVGARSEELAEHCAVAAALTLLA